MRSLREGTPPRWATEKVSFNVLRVNKLEEVQPACLWPNTLRTPVLWFTYSLSFTPRVKVLRAVVESARGSRASTSGKARSSSDGITSPPRIRREGQSARLQRDQHLHLAVQGGEDYEGGGYSDMDDLDGGSMATGAGAVVFASPPVELHTLPVQSGADGGGGGGGGTAGGFVVSSSATRQRLNELSGKYSSGMCKDGGESGDGLMWPPELVDPQVKI